jgi:hypothetical protein
MKNIILSLKQKNEENKKLIFLNDKLKAAN